MARSSVQGRAPTRLLFSRTRAVRREGMCGGRWHAPTSRVESKRQRALGILGSIEGTSCGCPCEGNCGLRKSIVAGYCASTLIGILGGKTWKTFNKSLSRRFQKRKSRTHSRIQSERETFLLPCRLLCSCLNSNFTFTQALTSDCAAVTTSFCEWNISTIRHRHQSGLFLISTNDRLSSVGRSLCIRSRVFSAIESSNAS